MFDFDVVTGPANPTRPVKPAALPAAKPMTVPVPAAVAAMRDDSREAAPSAADPADQRP